MIFDIHYALQIIPVLIQGVGLTVGATFGGMALALIVGLPLAVARMSSASPISFLAAAYIDVVRSTPLLVQLFFLFYVLPDVGIALPPLVAGVLGLGLNYASYAAEVYRSGVQSVARGQWEAAVALDFTPWQTWVHIILPQAIPPIIPTLANYLISMFKDTPLLAFVGVYEMLGVALSLASDTYKYFEPLTEVGLIFLLISIPAALAVRRLERWLGAGINS